MTTPPPPSTLLHLHKPTPPPSTLLYLHKPKPPQHQHPPFLLRATPDPNPTPSPIPDPDPDPFESRLTQVSSKYRSGQGKKAELRKAKKAKKSGSGSGSGSVFLPPVPLKEPRSDGLKVEFGFSPYSERVNGRLAGLGLAALLLVELATGKSVISYHTPAIVFIQVYFMVGVCALYLKFEKEKVSVWPQVLSNDKQP